MRCDNQEPPQKVSKSNAEALANMDAEIKTKEDLGLNKIVLGF